MEALAEAEDVAQRRLDATRRNCFLSHGKEGVSGSSPEEGSFKALQKRFKKERRLRSRSLLQHQHTVDRVFDCERLRLRLPCRPHGHDREHGAREQHRRAGEERSVVAVDEPRIQSEFFAPLDGDDRLALRELLQRLACHNDPRCAGAMGKQLAPEKPRKRGFFLSRLVNGTGVKEAPCATTQRCAGEGMRIEQPGNGARSLSRK